MKKIFIICPVRIARVAVVDRLEAYAKQLEDQGYEVHLPNRDTDQFASSIDICLQNAAAISSADEIHVFYRGDSEEIHFNMGMAFAMDIVFGNKKKVVIADNEFIMPGNSFPLFLKEWSEFRLDPSFESDN